MARGADVAIARAAMGRLTEVRRAIRRANIVDGWVLLKVEEECVGSRVKVVSKYALVVVVVVVGAMGVVVGCRGPCGRMDKNQGF
jgi:hypothetical protein